MSAFDYNHEIERELERTLVRDPSLAQELASARNLELALNRARDLAQIAVPTVGFDYGLYYSWVYSSIFAISSIQKDLKWQSTKHQLPSLIEGVARLLSKAELTNLGRRLAVQPCPSPHASTQEWQKYADALWIILHDERSLGHEWDLNDKESKKLNNYFYANELLVQCLKIAAVSDRQALLNGLLVLPKVESEKSP